MNKNINNAIRFGYNLPYLQQLADKFPSCGVCVHAYKHDCGCDVGENECLHRFEIAIPYELCSIYTRVDNDIDAAFIGQVLYAKHGMDKIQLKWWLYTHVICTNCDGTGEAVTGDGITQCSQCDGYGYIYQDPKQRVWAFAYTLDLNGSTAYADECCVGNTKSNIQSRYTIAEDYVIGDSVTRIGNIPVSYKIPNTNHPESEIFLCVNETGIVCAGTYQNIAEHFRVHLVDDLTPALEENNITVYTVEEFNEHNHVVSIEDDIELRNAVLAYDIDKYLLRYKYSDVEYLDKLDLAYAYVEMNDTNSYNIMGDCIDILSSEGEYKLALADKSLIDKVREDFRLLGIPNIGDNLIGRMLYDIICMLSDEIPNNEIEERLKAENSVVIFIFEYVLVGARLDEIEQYIMETNNSAE